MNAIQYGKLKIVARLGELIPAEAPAERGQGRSGSKSMPSDGIDLHDHTKVAYRKVAKHKAKLDAYYAQVRESGEQELLLSGLA